MRSILIFAALLLGAAQSAVDQPYELKGEAPGETTLKQFKANHKHADCSNPAPRQTTCQVYQGVSFAGVIAHTFKGCTLFEYEGQGISANFVDDKLVYLSYGVGPFSPEEQNEIIKVLTAKFGEPAERTQTSATWSNSIGSLSVSTVSLPDRNGSFRPVAVAITSALNDKGQSKDI